MRDDPGPGKLVGEVRVGPSKAWRVGSQRRGTVVDRAGPVGERGTGHGGKERGITAEATKEPRHCSTVIQTGNGGKSKAVQG